MPLAQIDIPHEEHTRIKAASVLSGVTLRKFLVDAAIKQAAQVLAKEGKKSNQS